MLVKHSSITVVKDDEGKKNVAGLERSPNDVFAYRNLVTNDAHTQLGNDFKASP